jgi:Amt family ammonium transporter
MPAGANSFAVSDSDYVAWFSSWVFAVASSTIPSGSMSERTSLEGYILLSAFVHSWVYPVFYHWVFHGWLARSFSGSSSHVGFIDFSGSAYVHSLGGAVALTGSIFLGARLGRFNSDGQPTYRGFKPYSYTMIGLGCLLLWTGWYACPPPSVLFYNHPSVLFCNTGAGTLSTLLV